MSPLLPVAIGFAIVTATNIRHELKHRTRPRRRRMIWQGQEQSSNVEDRRTGGWTEAMGISSPGDFARWEREFGPIGGGNGFRIEVYSMRLI